MNYPQWSDLAPADQQASAYYDFADAVRALSRCVVPMITEQSLMVTPRKHVSPAPGEGRQYVSRYIGVTRVHRKWAARWEVDRVLKTKLFTTAPEDELKAAWHRTRALGLAEPEVRR